MKIVVLIKEVPDTYGTRRLDLDSARVDRGSSDSVMDEICERAIESALLLADADKSTEIVLLTMGPESSAGILRKGLGLGATSAVHITDPALEGADLATTATVIAAAISRLGADLVVAGNTSTDGTAGVVPAMIAEHLNVAHITNVSDFSIDGATIRAHRTTEFGVLALDAELPTVVSVTEQAPEARFATFKGILGAKRKRIDTHTLADLGASVETRTTVASVTERPARTQGTKIDDREGAVEQLVEFLSTRGAL